ncbi:putative uncharacterized protein [Bacteroides sp. CAG:545]|nr:putative uncharacterized protein [Bacteroides sp. CAG:545]
MTVMRYTKILSVLILALLCGCRKETSPASAVVSVNIAVTPATRTDDPDEVKISDLNIFIFDAGGHLEESAYIDSHMNGGEARYSFSWIRQTDCRVFACANLGFRITGIRSVEDLKQYRYHLSYPDEYSRGLPMTGESGIVHIDDKVNDIDINLVSMMAKVSLCIDRTRLGKNVKFNVKSVQVGGCPKSACLFSQSKVSGGNDVFASGYCKSYGEADDLNIDRSGGVSREVSVYMLENMQGRLLPEAKTEKDKVLDMADAVAGLCSYIEIQAEYRSDSLYTGPGEYLKYRFYLGDSPSDFDVQRNCHYHIRVSPSGSGLEEDSWRIDKSSLLPYGKASIRLHPGNYVEGKVGSDLHIWAEIEPKGSRLSFGEEELEYDKSRGIYDYTMDKDGHGVTLHLKKPGSGILYIEGGAPASAAEMVVVTVLDSHQTENNQVRFSASVVKSPSPSGNAASPADFSLSACLGTEGAARTDYMWNMKVVKRDGGWSSSTPLYWMNDTDIRFYAFSPYPSSDNGISPLPAGGAPSLQFSAKAKAEEQIDLFAASDVRREGTVQLAFNHTLTAIRFRKGETFSEEAAITGISLSGIRGDGIYNIENGEWTGLSSERTFTMSDPSLAFLLPPQEFGRGSKACLNITVTENGDSETGSIPLEGHKWEKGRLTTYSISYSGGHFSVNSTENLFTSGDITINETNEDNTINEF